jgi:N-methylhydantoinase A
MKLAHPQELVDRWLRVGVTERFVPDGSEIAELDEQEVRQAARHFAEAGVKAVAVTFLWSMLYPQH